MKVCSYWKELDNENESSIEYCRLVEKNTTCSGEEINCLDLLQLFKTDYTAFILKAAGR